MMRRKVRTDFVTNRKKNHDINDSTRVTDINLDVLPKETARDRYPQLLKTKSAARSATANISQRLVLL